MAADLSQLLPFQKSGIRFLTQQPYVMLGDDTGLGKSVQCILAMEALHYHRILILCPKIGVVSWRIELGRWMLNKRPFLAFNDKQVSVPHGPLIYILPYSTLSVKHLRQRALGMIERGEHFDAVIIDEAHYLSNWASARTKAVYGAYAAYSGGIVDFAKPRSVWLLSGTIQRRDARDLYPHLKCLFPEAINIALRRAPDAKVLKRDYDEAFLRFSYNGFANVPVGNNEENIPKLREAMRPFMLARRKRDVAPELGSVRELHLPLGLDPDDPYAAAVKQPDFGKALVEELFTATSLHAALALTETAAEERRILGMIKVRPVEEWIHNFFHNGGPTDKLVIFAWHRDVLHELQERLAIYHPVIIMGGTTDKQRELAVHHFQRDPIVRVFLGQTIAASTSVTLTASSTVLTLEPDWIPANDYQAVSRVHRLGQTEPVFNYRAYADGTIDTRIFNRANARLKDFEDLMGELVTKETADAV